MATHMHGLMETVIHVDLLAVYVDISLGPNKACMLKGPSPS